ncbi:MFS general substrate transporter [Punctularia strigosozonata HHB-11173 SS5]|uniref:MFS general substrate transporter n=1 Tax=Punctularia strigosozonata (strain HHB-11173) TaxID=741275 RepID=UPI00044178D7|nr:MFS general substrate transporter [Punctularia strigosozonata HHB-11173 SS5]EIN09836.1 MFS general substrate transporter [Punctularia strigosozonata HHB-11173 SS5]
MSSRSASVSVEKGPHSPFHEGVHFGKVHELLFIIVISCAQLASLGQVVVPLEIIAKSLGTTDPAQESWTIAAYSLTVGTFVLPAGRLGDMYGHKRVLLVAYVWFALWSLVAGFSVYARKKKGPGAQALTSDQKSVGRGGGEDGERVVLARSGMATLLTKMAAGAMPCYFVIPADDILDAPDPETDGGASTSSGASSAPSDESTAGPRFDWLGAVLGIGGLVLVNFAWNQAPIVGWRTPYAYALLVVGVALVCAFLVVEGRVHGALVPTTIWNRHISMMLACIVLGWATFGIWNFYGTRFYIQMRGYTPLGAVASFTPVAVAGAIATALTGFLLPIIGPSLLMVVALTAFCVATVLFAIAPVHQTYWALTFVSTIIAPFGQDMSFPAASLVASNSVHRHQQGIAASLVNTFVNYSVSLGLGFAGTVETQLNRGGRTKADVLRGYRSAFYLGIGFSSLGIGVALLNLALDYRADRRGAHGFDPGSAREKRRGEEEGAPHHAGDGARA